MASDTALQEGRETNEASAQPSFSGRLLLRMPQTLHAELSRAAEREGTSLNQFIVGALTRSMGGPESSVRAARAAGETQTAPGAEPASAQPRLLGLALAVNLVAVVVAAAVAVVLLIAAWNGGF